MLIIAPVNRTALAHASFRAVRRLRKRLPNRLSDADKCSGAEASSDANNRSGAEDLSYADCYSGTGRRLLSPLSSVQS